MPTETAVSSSGEVVIGRRSKVVGQTLPAKTRRSELELARRKTTCGPKCADVLRSPSRAPRRLARRGSWVSAGWLRVRGCQQGGERAGRAQFFVLVCRWQAEQELGAVERDALRRLEGDELERHADVARDARVEQAEREKRRDAAAAAHKRHQRRLHSAATARAKGTLALSSRTARSTQEAHTSANGVQKRASSP
eukprot:6179900-Pleurochrysis_carterae.AAC.2